ncbi:MAG: response regulator [Candidatus Riflebacteria bacterium]|nr:response regulator [Candidatus Riflebacteria bacterium]
MTAKQHSTFQEYVFRLEVVSFVLTIGILFFATRFITGEIQANYVKIRQNDARKIGIILDGHLGKANEELTVFGSSSEEERSSRIVRELMVTFADIYLLDKNLSVEHVYKKSMHSRIFKGFTFAGSELEKLISGSEDGKSISSLVRGMENDRPSLYLAQKHNGNWLLGRVDMSSINQLVSQTAIFSDTPVLFLAHDGFVLATTHPELQLYSLDLNREKIEQGKSYIEAGNRRWLAIMARSDIFGKNIAVLVPLDLMNKTHNSLIILFALFVMILLTVSIIKHRSLRAKILQPLNSFTRQLSWVEKGDYQLPDEKSDLVFSELISLQSHFNTMAQSIKAREESLVNGREELRNEKELLSVTLRSIGDAVITTDISGNILTFNPVAEKLVCLDAASATGKPFDQIVSITDLSGQPVNNAFLQLFAQEITIEKSFEVFLVSRLKTRHRITCSRSPMLNNEGEKIGFVIAFKDVTREHELHQQLMHTQKMDAIGQLAGGVAHDFNNMLGGIMGAAELLKLDKNLSPQQEKTVNLIIQASLRAVELTSKLLTFGRKGKLVSTPISIIKVIQDTIDLLSRTIDKRITILSSFEDNHCMVVGDDSQIQNALLNLGINASHAMPTGGTLSFNVSKIFFDAETCKLSPFSLNPGQFIAIEVKDSGCGIPPENLARIFEPFYTTRDPGKGTGLGLAAVYGTVRDHHGAINVYSEVGIGTIFHIYLPASDSEGTAVPANEEIITGKGRILLTDDEEIIRITAQMMLESLGYEVLLAENGAKAVEIIKQQKERIDLVILDMIMPVMNGKEAFRLIRELYPDCRVVISSGFHKSEDLEEMKKTGLAGYIRKPFRKYELSQVVSEALKKG